MDKFYLRCFLLFHKYNNSKRKKKTLSYPNLSICFFIAEGHHEEVEVFKVRYLQLVVFYLFNLINKLLKK